VTDLILSYSLTHPRNYKTSRKSSG